MKEIEYNGYYITIGMYAGNDITVDYCGDDIVFSTIEEAKDFIDSIA